MRIAIYHNLGYGGAKRAMYEQCLRLKRAGHSLVEYTVGSFPDEGLSLRDLIESSHVLTLQPRSHEAQEEASTLLNRVRRRLLYSRYAAPLWWVLGYGLRKAVLGSLDVDDHLRNMDNHLWDDEHRDTHAQQIAAAIDADGCDVVIVHPCVNTQSAYVLRHLKTPSVYYCQEPMRYAYDWFPHRVLPDGLEREADRLSTTEYVHLKRNRGVTLERGMAMDGARREFIDLLRHTDKQNARSADLILANSYFSAEAIYRAYGRHARVNYLGVNTDVFYPTPHVVREEDLIVTVGSVGPMKGHDWVIRAAGAVSKPLRPRVQVVGNASFSEQIEIDHLYQLAREMQVDLIIQQDITDDLLRDAYNRAALVVCAPVLEPFGFIPLEAMACGTPVIGVAQGGIRESVTDGVTGLLVDRDAEALGGAIASLLADPQRRSAMGRAGIEDVHRRWTWERSVTELEGHLRRVVTASRTGLELAADCDIVEKQEQCVLA